MDCKAVIGIYGVSGCGKSRILSLLQASHPEWRCLEGSSVIHSIMEQHGESLNDFHTKKESEKDEIRNRAVKKIRDYRGVTIVTGHCSFPEVITGSKEDGNDVTFNDIFTNGDGETFDAILYLDKDPMNVYLQREQDNETSKRARPSLPAHVLQQWREHEKQVLQKECDKNDIQFELIQNDDTVAKYIAEHIVAPLATNVQKGSTNNLREAVATIPSADVFLLIDGDRTLCSIDTGKVFVDRVWDGKDPIKAIFERYDSYTFQAFLEVAMFYANVMPTLEYKDVSQRIGCEHVDIQDEWVRFLSSLPPNVHAIVLTSGNREIWRAALDSNALANGFSLLAGNHVGLHSYIVDSHAKADVVKELRDLHGGCKILSFGDSAVDIPMLCASDEGYVVIDDRQNRSMKDFIAELVDSKSAQHIHQLSLLQDCSFLHNGIQVASLRGVLDALVSSNIHKVLDCAPSVAARIIADQSRRSDMNGPALQEIHVQIGQFLADQLLNEVGRCGLLTEKENFSHVRGTLFTATVTSGNVLILPLMRGGEPMSRGVYQRFPGAQLLHYDDKDDGQSNNAIDSVLTSNNGAIRNIIIVDSVVNEGKSVSRALASLMEKNLNVFVLTAVMQHDASLKLPKLFPRVRFIALRVSANKYKGKGSTDTGNRLFGTYL